MDAKTRSRNHFWQHWGDANALACVVHGLQASQQPADEIAGRAALGDMLDQCASHGRSLGGRAAYLAHVFAAADTNADNDRDGCLRRPRGGRSRQRGRTPACRRSCGRAAHKRKLSNSGRQCRGICGRHRVDRGTPFANRGDARRPPTPEAARAAIPRPERLRPQPPRGRRGSDGGRLPPGFRAIEPRPLEACADDAARPLGTTRGPLRHPRPPPGPAVRGRKRGALAGLGMGKPQLKRQGARRERFVGDFQEPIGRIANRQIGEQLIAGRGRPQ